MGHNWIQLGHIPTLTLGRSSGHASTQRHKLHSQRLLKKQVSSLYTFKGCWKPGACKLRVDWICMPDLSGLYLG
jgi:hypothetical protein